MTKQIHRKKISRRPTFFLGCFVVGVFIYLYTQSELRFIFYPEIDTIFAPGFSQQKFSQIEAGMTKQEILDILGEPLNIMGEHPALVCWQYSTDGKLWPYADFSYFLYQVCFQNNLVASTPVYEFSN